MKRNTFDKYFLRVVSVIILAALLPITLRKPPIKDWIIVYLFNATTNVYTDKVLSSFNIVRYPVRFFSKVFKTHILFDLLIYPLFTILYNQITYKNDVKQIIYKVFYFTIPMLLIELWAERKTNLIEWNKNWKWYHTFLSLTLKSLLTRSFMGIIRIVDTK